MSKRKCDLPISKNYLLISYISVWAAYLFSCLVTPAKSLYKETHTQAVLLVLGYVVLSAAFTFLLTALFSKKSLSKPSNGLNLLYDNLKPRRLIVLMGFLILCGLLLHFYDKIFIMNIDYSAGIAKARHEWIANGIERGGGISSWQSAAGHILTNFFFTAMSIVLLFWKELLRFHKYFGYCVSVIAVLIYSGSMGSRSVPLFFLLLVISILVMRKSLGKRFLPKGFRCLFALLVLLIFTYNIFVFHKRGKVHGGNSPKQYTRSFFSQLRGKETSRFISGEKLPGFLSELYYYGILTTIYVNHNQWTFDYILTLDERPGQSMFNSVYGGLAKTGIIGKEQLEKRAFRGVFLSLPGCAYYDFGLPGMVIISMLHGTFLFAANHLVRKRKLTVWYLFLFILVGMFSLISPLTSAANLMSFPYLIISCLSLPILVIIAKLPLIKPN
jgi:hypothetical protein